MSLLNDTGQLGPANHRIQATACGAAVLDCRVGRSPAAPDAERYPDGESD
jgi:hypothetical protein